MARAAQADIERRPYLELVNEPDLTVLCIRRIGWSADDYHRWSAGLLADGVAMVTPTEVDGEIMTRICVVNPRTTDGRHRHDPGYDGVMAASPSRSLAAGRVLVMKFGGTSVADADKIRRVAHGSWPHTRPAGSVVGVVSAMGNTTDQLVDLAAAGVASARTRARWTCCSRPASGSPPRCARWRSTISATRRCR